MAGAEGNTDNPECFILLPFSDYSIITILPTVKFLRLQESDNVLSAISCFLIGNGNWKQLSDWSELELSTVSDFCTL